MTVTCNEKMELDLQDLRRIVAGLEEYARLGLNGAILRLKEHPEDVFCEVADYSGAGKVMCTRDAHDAILEIAARHRESLPVPDDYSVTELLQGIKKNLGRAMVDEQSDEAVLERVLTTAVNEVSRSHRPRTFHFPCVIVSSQHPQQFAMGPVEFITAKAFPELYANEIQQYLGEVSNGGYGRERVERFKQHLLSLGWLATVQIPSCGYESGKERAELAITTAINILRLLFGIPHARDMRLVHSSSTVPAHSEYATTENGKMDFAWTRKCGGAVVEEDWYAESLKLCPVFWSHSEHLVRNTVQGKRSETANRVIDALGWFGKAAFEDTAGSQVIDFVAALERLTSTDWFHIHNFCSRVALLARKDDNDMEDCYWRAYRLHNTRSAAMHGAFSPKNGVFLKGLKAAHELTRYALFRGMEMHCFLEDAQGRSQLADLDKFFIREQSRHRVLFTGLRAEMKTKEAIKQKLKTAEALESFLVQS